MTVLLDVQNLSVSFGASRVVDGASFSIGRGETVALVGESGSGKTISALSVLRLTPDNARLESDGIIFDGRDLRAADESQMRALRGGKIAMIFQEPMTSLNPLHTIGDQVAETLTVHKGLDREAALERTLELLETVALRDASDRLNAYPYELSGGERQRVMIAMALANEPKLLIADEPTTALDVTVQAQILALLQRLQKRFHMAVLFISHDLDVVSRIASRVYVMKNGKIVESGATQDVLAHPAHDCTKRLIAARSLPPPQSAVQNAAPVLQVRGVSVEFPVEKDFFGRPTKILKAVDAVSLTVRQGQCVGLVGESGSGKSTLGAAILQLAGHTGSVDFQGVPLESLKGKKMRAVRKNIQIVFQDPYASLNPRMKIADILREGLNVHFKEMTRAQKDGLILKTLQEVGLDAAALDRYPHEFSGGQRQRIAIARAVVLRPELIVLDEPTSALDVSVQAQIVALLKDLQRRSRLSYLFISHDMRVVRSMADVVYVMKNGKIVESGENPVIFKEPKELYTRTLLNAAFDFKTGA